MGSFGVARRELYEELPSTQDRAIELARAGAEEGSVVVARRQSRGRGRGDRRWASPAGGLYLSVVVRGDGAPELLPLAVASELAAALGEAYGLRLRLRWPNDLLVIDRGGTPRKLAGILSDRVRTAAGRAAVVVGVGLNGQRPDPPLPEPLRGAAAVLEEVGQGPVDLDRLEELVVAAVGRGGRLLADPRGPPTALARARGLLYGVGEPVSADGTPVGILRGLATDGALEVLSAHGVRALRTGDVQVGVAG